MDLKKNIGKKVRKNLTAKVKSVDVDEGIVEAIIATDTEDRHGEVLDINGLDLALYKQNPVVAWAHKYDEPPIAQTLSIRKTHNGKLVAKMKFAKDEYPFAEQIYKLYKGRYLRAFSIGFVPQEVEGNVYTKSEMLEYSAVLIPANSDALALAVKNGIDIDLVKKKSDKEEDKEESKKEVKKKPKKKVVKKAKKVKKKDNYIEFIKSLNSKLKEVIQENG